MYVYILFCLLFSKNKIKFTFRISIHLINQKVIITIKEIARLANISAGTVDRIIHNRGHVTQKNVDKVNAIIKEHGFKKNIFASNLAFNKKFKFVVFLPKFNDLEYWKTQFKGIKKAEEEFKQYGVQLEYFLYDFDPVSFDEMSKEVLALAFDGLLFSPVFYNESIAFLNKYQKLERPVVMIDSDVSKSLRNAYIGQDAFKSGYMAGKLVSLTTNDLRKVLIVKITTGIGTTSVYVQRIDGFNSYFREKLNDPTFNLSEISIDVTKQNQLNIDMFKDTYCFFVPNSRAHILAHFFETNNIKSKKIIGYDLLENNVKYLKNGGIDFLINQKPEKQGYKAVSYLTKQIVLKETVIEEQYMPLEIVIKENL